ncbi:sigma-70 family RNA polymerase sigma factor [Antarcticibacterium flavum]|uniref:Sigma-70 family RNA polymerase sigma factor n=1 Tax=Antarcticibacterium flavum TaxID=2058175 RepID=A0A5B7WZL3_9FLAO|nr:MULTISPECIES: sigma-70 family RNA polymerase sigma factor [Antarcticibacterium]MCM4161259.1 RNA polymerase subunit sigma-70 [Antarcticibacterium sp. W02-3]QCY68425.1 sigma-70 family RNA polymerase sigma factor [Antarcticibacterium flavum]
MEETQKIWDTYKDELYFFILKRVKEPGDAGDIFQNTFLKIHRNLERLKDHSKIRAWAYSIARNEIANFFDKESLYVEKTGIKHPGETEIYEEVCCFDRFINELPGIYKEAIELVYICGKKQQEAADTLEISLANLKARVRRAKELLKQKFNECCKYEIDEHGDLVGESNCAKCE